MIRIKREKRWLKAFLHRERPDLIISDNRYGLWSRDVFCVFVTHQLHIRTPFGRVGDLMLQQMNYHFIR
ncbi:MAG TPA: hypothetical protein VG605_18450, partial [Puia sp.]|nr:hypothetical protein [Puia sp.]